MKNTPSKALRIVALVTSLVAPAFLRLSAQHSDVGELHVRISYPGANEKTIYPPAVVWLASASPGPVAAPPPARFTLMQKNRMFMPHLLVIPVGSTVSFPNADPFFHNVFSLFNGKKFDLGLYEAGASKDVIFSREGVSYVFCNIHPEMSAVVLSLATPFFAVAGPSSHFALREIPPGEYDLHVWVEGVPERTLYALTRRVRIKSGVGEPTVIDLPAPPNPRGEHLNMFGQAYDHATHSPY